MGQLPTSVPTPVSISVDKDQILELKQVFDDSKRTDTPDHLQFAHQQLQPTWSEATAGGNWL